MDKSGFTDKEMLALEQTMEIIATQMRDYMNASPAKKRLMTDPEYFLPIIRSPKSARGIPNLSSAIPKVL